VSCAAFDYTHPLYVLQDAGGSGSDQARYSVILYTGDVPGGGTHGQVRMLYVPLCC
jgi:hypothetical protein